MESTASRSIAEHELSRISTICSAHSPGGRIPDGEPTAPPSSLPAPPFSTEIAKFVSIFAWQGKNFDAERGVLANRILPFGLNAIIAKVYKGESWLDGKECIVLDYSKTSLVAHWIRDEIRRSRPRPIPRQSLLGKKRLIDFVLHSNSSTGRRSRIT